MAYSTGTIAQGCFGKVYKEKYNDTWAAIKKVPQNLISRRDLERECEVYNKATHPNIVKLLGNITLRENKWIIPLEFIFGEDLETTIFKASKSKIQLTPSTKGTIIVGMCEGLYYLHSKDIVHQDLKPENIMVEHSTNRAVIIDLGLAKFFRNGLNSAMEGGNEAYSPPEVLQRHSQRDQRSDVWAMGKIIAELCARIRLHTPSVCPAKIKETLRDQPFCPAVCKMVETEPLKRASMKEVIHDIRRARDADTTVTPNNNFQKLSPSTVNRDPSPVKKTPLQLNKDPSPVHRAALLVNRDPLPLNKGTSPLNWERSPRQDIKVLHQPSALHHPFSPAFPKTEDKNMNQALVPTGGNDITRELMKMRLYQEAAKDLPCDLPVTGRVVVRRFEEKDGEMETWEQKEVVTRDGKIIKFDDVRFNSK